MRRLNVYMKRRKKITRRHRPLAYSGVPRSEHYLVVVRSWMLIVLFALMLGVGAIVGNFFNQKLNETTPQVAGVQVEFR